MAMSTINVGAGEDIFRQGEAGHDAFIIRKGQVAILHRDARGQEAAIAFRGPGELIGEMALASRELRSATAQARTACILVALSRDEIEQRVAEADPILQIVLQTAFARLREIMPVQGSSG
ncbi:MAG: cyclic nucleotide-binding domain-containing protein [Pseudomonadota bacterium]